jgi:deazaflavin-dependent oxidoreductase (nitroreductase family)
MQAYSDTKDQEHAGHKAYHLDGDHVEAAQVRLPRERRVGTAIGGTPVLLLTTSGRRSGEPRPVTLTYFEDGNRFVVVASNAGENRHPAWWLNLEEHPDATVQIGGTTTRVRVAEAAGEERERLWAELIRRDPSYEEYRRRTSRRIPVVLLQPTGSDSDR